MFIPYNVLSISSIYLWIAVFTIAAVIGIGYNIYVKLTCGKFQDKNVNLAGKTILITGCNSGLGKAVAKYMAFKGARIIMACRNQETAEKAKEEIITYSENHNVVLHHLDLASFDSIRKFVKIINETESKIDILIHNAGYCGAFRSAKTAENIEMTMAVNYYGPFLLTHLLIDLMKKSAPSKIITVASKAHSVACFNPNDTYCLNPVNFFLPTFLYANSKFACFLFTYELARRLEGTGVTANILHPGTCDSPIWNKTPFPVSIPIFIARKFMKSIQQGTQTILHVALSKHVEGVTGQYYRDCKPKKSVKGTYRKDLQNTLWEESKKIVKMAEHDPHI
ncbi:retinol dehydrogenase 14-like [Chironomus tepperi]|uniref:retinol dehydrogenase 14-like n=1 Tax=Chironomus tepperi TaxID=113505 RepID=UPI00391EFEDA